MISIITPVYNSAKYLRQCLDSMLAQTYTDWEWLLIDDGSTDESLEILKEYEARDSRIRVFSQKNSGPAAARNIGLTEMRGSYVTFIDSDDWFMPETLETALSVIEKTNVDMVLWNFKYFDNGKMSKSKRINPAAGYHGKEETKKFALDFVYNVNGSQYMNTLWIRLFRADIIRNNSLRFCEELRRTEDFTFNAELQFYLESFYALPDKEFTIYRMNQDSITHNYVENYLDMVAIIIEKLESNPIVCNNDGFKERINCFCINRLQRAIYQEVKYHYTSFFDCWNAVNELINKPFIKSAINDIDFAFGINQFGKTWALLKLNLNRLYYLRLYSLLR